MDRRSADNPLIFEVNAFLIDRQARRLSPATLEFYRLELRYFTEHVGAVDIPQLTPTHIREYLIALSSHRSPGGVHAAYRAIKAFLRWYWAETNQPGANPVTSVPAPKTPNTLRAGASTEQIRALLTAANCHRDKAILLALLDTGLRKAEFVALDVSDINLSTGSVMVRSGKGGKSRLVFLGAASRRELIRYIRQAKPTGALWLSKDKRRLTAAGLRQVVRRLAARAGVPCPGLHDFRRAFALECLRNGMDIFSLMRLMGHTSPAVLYRYLKLLPDDLQVAHARASPADRL